MAILARRALTLAAPALLAAAPAAAQRAAVDARADVEAASVLGGRALPAGYFTRIQRDPNFLRYPNPWPSAARRGPDGALAGTLPVVVINALFADSPVPGFASSETQRVLFDGPSTDGTLTQYYREVSGNRLTVTGTAVPWVRTSITRADAVGSEYGLGADARLGEYFAAALALADPGVDFGKFDNDGPDNVPNSGDDDGRVDLVVFQYWEVNASCGGNGIWPHFSGLSGWMPDGQPYATHDLRPNGQPVLVDFYITQSARSCTAPTPQPPSTIAHEVGHLIGLPDIYDPVDGLLPAQRRWVLGCFSLMAGGSWGCGDGSTGADVRRPTHLGPWEKMREGWIHFQAADPARLRQEFTLGPVQTTGEAVMVPLRGDREYLLIEYRPAIGFDADLPGSGVLVYRVDLDGQLSPCSGCPPRYLLTLLEADGDSALLRTPAHGGNRGVAGDMLAAGKTWVLNAGSVPALRLATGEATGRAIRVTVVGGTARVVVSHEALAIAPERVLQPFLGNSAATPLTAAERAALDSIGNRNGQFDVGDLRAYLRLEPDAAHAAAALAPGLVSAAP